MPLVSVQKTQFRNAFFNSLLSMYSFFNGMAVILYAAQIFLECFPCVYVL